MINRKRSLQNIAFVLPSVLIILVFFFIPIIIAFFISFTDFDLYSLNDIGNLRFIGFANYIEIISSGEFKRALFISLVFVFLGTPLTIATSLLIALLLNHEKLWFKSWWRTIFFAPFVTSIVASAIVFRYIFHAKYGALNFFIEQFGLNSIDWLGNEYGAIFAIIIFSVWKNSGYYMVIFLAALQNVPKELIEAAKIDGANSMQRFWHVTLRAISPAFVLILLMAMVGFFQIFAEPYILTQGGPAQKTITLSYLMFEQGFRWWNLGYASAIAFIIFIIVAIIAVIQNQFSKMAGNK